MCSSSTKARLQIPNLLISLVDVAANFGAILASGATPTSGIILISSATWPSGVAVPSGRNRGAEALRIGSVRPNSRESAAVVISVVESTAPSIGKFEGLAKLTSEIGANQLLCKEIFD